MQNIPAYLDGRAVLLGTVESGPFSELSGREIMDRLEQGIWPDGSGKSIFDIVRPGEKTVFVVSDHTRKTAIDRILPLVAERLVGQGCAPDDWEILIASGIHRHPSGLEIEKILGPEMCRLFAGRISCSDPDDESVLKTAGTTSRGFPVSVNRKVLECDRLILTGTVTYHYHAGFGGGRKSLVPGCASRKTIAYNHSLVLDPLADRIRPGVDIGVIKGNIVSEEMLSGAKLCEPDCIINTVLTDDGLLAGVFCGDLEAAHEEACRMAEEVERCDIKQAADFVVASTDAARNWIQSHKALFNAARAVRDGGWIVLDAPCPEGLGDERFRYWITRPTVRDIYSELRASVEVLGQTALSTRARGVRCILVTDMPQADLDDLGIRCAPSLEAAVDAVLAELRLVRPVYYLMPHARYTVPFTEAGCGA